MPRHSSTPTRPEQVELAGRRPNRPAFDEHLARGEIDLQAAEAKLSRVAARARAAEDRLDAGPDLRRVADLTM